MNRLGIIICGVIFLTVISLFIINVERSREVARQTQCLNNMRNIGVGVQIYATDHHGDLPATQAGQPPQSWRIHLVPYLICSCMYDEYCFDLPWNEGVNLETAQNGMEILGCPDDPSTELQTGFSITSYSAITGTNTMWGKQKSLTLDEVTKADGLTNTILICEADAEEIVWTEPRDVDLDEKKIGIATRNQATFKSACLMTSMHDGITNVIFADGKGKKISEKIDSSVLNALCTAKGGEAIESVDF